MTTKTPSDQLSDETVTSVNPCAGYFRRSEDTVARYYLSDASAKVGPRQVLGIALMKRLSWRDAFSAWLQFAGLWALVIAWPVYQTIASGPEALTGLGVRRLDLAVVIAVVSLIPPTALTLAEALLAKFFPGQTARRFHAVILGSFFGLFVWQHLTSSGTSTPLRQLIPILIWAGAAYLYLRSKFVESFVDILGLATPVVIVAFCLRYPISYEVLPHDSPTKAVKISSDTPVVVIVFDELPLASLENRTGQIDSGLFPAFGKLASSSTWYPDMTTAADSTTVAVPAILTGENPPDRPWARSLPPGLPSYPDNLCSGAANGGYKVFAFEPLTDLCDRTWGLGTRVSNLIQSGITNGDDLFPTSLEMKGAAGLTKPFAKPWIFTDRDDAVDYFIENMPGTKRSVSVLHSVLSHVFWEYMPDGTTYTPEPFDSFEQTMPSDPDQVTHLMQQHLLQLAFTDRQLGRVIERMKEQGIWDKALFVVTADHGGSFIPGVSRRVLTGQNLGWVLPVPLFIKYPGQKTGTVVHGPADSRDITPTVFDVLGGDKQIDGKGRSLFTRKRLTPRKWLDVQGQNGPMKPLWSKVKSQFRIARNQRNATFGNGQFYALGGHQGLIGKTPAQVEGLTPLAATISDPDTYANVDPASGTLPSYLRAVLHLDDKKDPGDLAVALNGRIVATARAWVDNDLWATAVNLPDRGFRAGPNRIKLYGMPSR